MDSDDSIPEKEKYDLKFLRDKDEDADPQINIIGQIDNKKLIISTYNKIAYGHEFDLDRMSELDDHCDWSTVDDSDIDLTIMISEEEKRKRAFDE